jgi:four helix bundle protein
MLANFRVFQLSKEAYLKTQKLNLNRYLYDQLTRASLSVSLNLAEGKDRESYKEKHRFYNIALTSCRECQALVELINNHELQSEYDRIAAMIWRLCEYTKRMKS